MKKFSAVALLCLFLSLLNATQMSGNYTVGSDGDFESLTGANGFFNAINTRGLSGDVTALITSDLSETGAVQLFRNTDDISKKIFIKPNSTAIKTITGTNTANDVISINRTRQVTIDGDYDGEKALKIVNNSTSKYAIYTHNNSSELIIKNCIIESNAKGIYIGVSLTSTVENCDIRINEASGFVYAINATSTSNLLISNNKITLNENQNTNRYIYGIHISPPSGSTTNIYNNMLFLKSNTTSTHNGIYIIANNENMNIYHNTIYIDGVIPSSTNESALCIYHQNSSQNLNIKNNILVNKKQANNTAYKVAGIGFVTTTSTINYNLNNNIYNTNTIGYYGTVVKNTLNNWQTTWTPNKELQSKVLTPSFVSSTDLHLTITPQNYLDYLSTESVGITYDIDGDLRNNIHPFIGADEVIIDDTLPVHLSSFTVSNLNNGSLTLNWTTEAESNMLGYHILKSTTSDLKSASRISFEIIRAYNSSSTNKYTFTDQEVYENNEYFYWLQSFEYDGTIEYFGPINAKINITNQENPIIPLHTELGNAFPNPFNPATRINFSLNNSTNVSITIYNTRGQKVKTLINEHLSAGTHFVTWDGKDNEHKSCASGIYFYKMQTDTYTNIKKMLMIK